MKKVFNMSDPEEVSTNIYRIQKREVNIMQSKNNKNPSRYHELNEMENHLNPYDNDNIDAFLNNFEASEESSLKEYVYGLEKLEYIEKEKNGYIIKQFNMSNLENENQLIIISYLKNKVVLNLAQSYENEIAIHDNNLNIKYENIETNSEKRFFAYTPTAYRKIFILNMEDGSEVDPTYYFYENEKIGICKLKPNKKYLAIEIRGNKSPVLVAGICEFQNKDGKYKTIVNENEAKRIELNEIFKDLNKGKAKTYPLKSISIEREI